jgi:glycosyltransferase involved in cell wall biosynthesis
VHVETGVRLVIPAWNEAEAIGAVLDEVPRHLVDEVLVIVGGEDDPTGSVARAHAASVLVQCGRGYGAACRTGASAAIARGSSVIAFLDGDYSDPPAELDRLLAPIEHDQADLVLGRRDLRRFPRALPVHARLGNAAVCLLLRLLLDRSSPRFEDLPSFKAIRASALSQLDMCEMTYGWTVEMLVKASRAGLRIQQIPIDYRPRHGGQSKVGGSVRGSLGAAYKLLGCAITYATAPRAFTASGPS